MMIDDKKSRETGIFHPEDFIGQDFEVIYEGDLPELPTEGLSDNYKDVLDEAAKALYITIGKIIKSPMEGLIKYHSNK